ncbi:hypothetical protein KSS87_017844 [Heliosperma pusillum]|nr:hypothetical protein KSS87_017844 [Heliosperma pusillum]
MPPKPPQNVVGIFSQLQNASEAFRTYIRDGFAQLNLPLNHDQKSHAPLSGNATHPKLKCQVCRTLWRMKQELKLRVRGLERAKKPLLIIGSRSYPVSDNGANDGLTGLELWWFWQRNPNHAIQTRKPVPTTLHFSCNDCSQNHDSDDDDSDSRYSDPPLET